MAEHEPERRCDGGDAGRLPENRLQDLAARHAERPQDAERLRSLQDREGHRAVDQEHADDERQQAERREVRAERRGQLAERAVLGLGRDEHGAGGRRCRERARLRLGQLEVDAVDAAERPEQLLRRRDVGHDRRLGLQRRRCPSGTNPSTRTTASRPPIVSVSRVAACDTELAGQLFRQQHGAGLGDQPRECRRRAAGATCAMRSASSPRIGSMPSSGTRKPGRPAMPTSASTTGAAVSVPSREHELAVRALVESAVERQQADA